MAGVEWNPEMFEHSVECMESQLEVVVPFFFKFLLHFWSSAVE